MEKIILEYIEKEAKKLAARFHKYHNVQELEYQRNRRRINLVAPKSIYIPRQWEVDKKFNPFYVLKHCKQISHSIANKLNNGTYMPNLPYMWEIDKPNGGKRKINIYQIPDAAVSNFIYRRLLSKNKHRFSSLAYAYRNDRNAHYAIQDISLELKSAPRMFISEFDFTDFFGSIDHSYLLQQLDQNGFLISNFEKKIIEKFIKLNERGIPQGTSISLFLANMVCWKLDRKLEQEGLRFARYADDTIIWSTDYTKICRSVEIINAFSNKASIPINFKKSSGISLLTRSGDRSEMAQHKEYVEFLGYKLSPNNVSIKEASAKRIKKQISYLLYRNLLQPLKSRPLRVVTVPNSINSDPAFITAIMQIRRYLYGNLNDEILTKYINGTYKKLSFKGAMSYYPLIDDEGQLKELDRWLIKTIINTLRLRQTLWMTHNYNVATYFPFTLTIMNSTFAAGNWEISLDVIGQGRHPVV